MLLRLDLGERYDFVITADQPVGAYWIQARGLGECGIRRVQQLGILRYARGPYQPTTNSPTYDVGLPQGVVSTFLQRILTPIPILETILLYIFQFISLFTSPDLLYLICEKVSFPYLLCKGF